MSQTDSRLHPQSAALLAEMGSRPGSPSVELARAGHELLTANLVAPGPAMARVEELRMAGIGANPPVAVRRFVPEGAPRRAIVYLHGGGWVTGTLDTYDALCRELARRADAQVFSVGYRLAPEAPSPAAFDDCEAALAGVLADAPALGIDPGRVVLAGDSAGGHLALGVARRRRHAGAVPPLAGLVLIYPVTDVGLDSASMAEFESGFYLSRDLMLWFWRKFLGTDPQDRGDDPELAPLRAADLGSLPPSFVVTAGCDILRDEGEALVERIRQQGGRSELLRVPGMLHGFIRFGSRIDGAGEALAAIADRVRKLTG
jgi:acetyl esterase